jgi:hypothetical protein
MKNRISIVFIFVAIVGFSQTKKDTITTNNQQQNAAQTILNNTISKGLTIGGYGQVDYNQEESNNGTLDIHRMIILIGYKFNDKVQFVSEIEYEHVKEVFVEQLFLNYGLSDNMNLRAGLMLVPMGIINEYHEPTVFNGVERPSMDKSIVPSTWREIGVGISGRIDNANMRYQAYVFNGFSSVNGSKVLGGANGLRNGRQKGAESTINTPNFSGKIDFYGIQGLRLGFLGYFGRTQAADEVDKLDGADVGIRMLGLDARYTHQRFSARGQFVHAAISDTKAYNIANNADLGSALQGWYLEAAYNLLSPTKEQRLVAFTRYETYDTHASVDESISKNLAYDRKELTFGLSYHIAPGAVVKADYQLKDNALPGVQVANQLNFGLGFWF